MQRNVGESVKDRLIPALAASALIAVLAASLAGPALSDEVFTLEAARLSGQALWRHLEADVHPPLYYYLIKGWLALAGADLAALRAFSLLMAALAALLAGSVLPRQAAGRGWAAWFFAADGIVLVMSIYGRMYTLLAALCLLAWLASDRHLREGGRGWAVFAGATVAAGLCTHHFFALYLVSLAAWLILAHRGVALRLLPGWGVGTAIWALVWGRTAWEQLTRRPQHLAWVQPAAFEKWAEVAGAHVIFFAAALPLGLAAFAWRRRTRNEWPAESRAAAVAAAITLALPGAISVWKPVLNPRFTIIAAPFLAVALAPLGRLTAGVLPVTAFAAAAAWLWWPGTQTSCTSAEAARQLAATTTSADTVLFCRLTRKPVEYHWRNPAAQRRSFPAEIDSHPGYEGKQPREQLLQEARSLAASLNGRVFVLADTGRLAPQILLRALEEAGFRPREPLLACSSAGKHYFDRLLVFDPPVRQAESPSGGPPGTGSPPPDPAARAYAPR